MSNSEGVAKTNRAVTKNLVISWIWKITLPSFIAIIRIHYKDPYEPISIIEWHKGFERCSIGMFISISPTQLSMVNIAMVIHHFEGDPAPYPP